MTRSKPTPGPWVIDEQYIRTDAKGIREEDGWICQWQAYTNRANAKLICAAPDLLHAAQLAHAELLWRDKTNEPTAAVMALTDAINKAID